MPFPKEEVTPPVMKIYLIVAMALVWMKGLKALVLQTNVGDFLGCHFISR